MGGGGGNYEELHRMILTIVHGVLEGNGYTFKDCKSLKMIFASLLKRVYSEIMYELFGFIKPSLKSGGA